MTPSNDQPKSDRIDEIQDLPVDGETAKNADQVKGGFNPQPDPPVIGPVFQPPVYNYGGFVRY